MGKNVKFEVEDVSKDVLLVDFTNLDDYNLFTDMFGIKESNGCLVEIHNYDFKRPKHGKKIELDLDNLKANYDVVPTDSYIVCCSLVHK